MPDPQEPRSFLVDPKLFGDESAEWLTGVDLSDREMRFGLARAYLQHHASATLRAEAKAAGSDLGSFATGRLDYSDPEDFRRKLRGETPFVLRELLEWILDFGIDVLPVLESRDGVLPAEYRAAQTAPSDTE